MLLLLLLLLLLLSLLLFCCYCCSAAIACEMATVSSLRHCVLLALNHLIRGPLTRRMSSALQVALKSKSICVCERQQRYMQQHTRIMV